MYVVTHHAKDPEAVHTNWAPGLSRDKARELGQSQNFVGVVDDLEKIVEHNKIYKDILAEQNRGRPGFYYGKEVVIEGAMPVAMMIAAAQEFDGDPDWWRDDRKFENYMLRHPEFDWRRS